MRYNEFEKEIECWGQKHGYVTKIMIEDPRIYIMIESFEEFRTIATVSNVDTLLLDMDWPYFEEVEKLARVELFKIVAEFAATKPEDRGYEKRFIIPLPGLITTDGRQQYMTHKDCHFFACRRNPHLRQTWKEEHLKFVPEMYRQFAVEFDEEEEY